MVKDALVLLDDFDGIFYAKGVVVFKQLVVYFGDDVFFVGVNVHIVVNEFGNVIFVDLFGKWIEVGVVGLDDWV